MSIKDQQKIIDDLEHEITFEPDEKRYLSLKYKIKQEKNRLNYLRKISKHNA